MKSLLKLLLLFAVFDCFAQSQIITIENFKSKFIQARNVEVWLPPAYAINPKQKFPVLYMQDGQNVFNPETSTHKIAWEADDTAAKMIARQKINPFIIVAVWSSEERYREYFPEKAAKNFTSADLLLMDKVKKQKNIEKSDYLGDEYLLFLTSELKPYIDKNYRTKPDAANTSICGSSMGALIALYAICEYPAVFGQAACISTHWPLLPGNSHIGPSEAIKKYVSQKLPDPQGHRIYFDHGTETLDKYYEVHQNTVDNILKFKGYTDKNWLTKKYEHAAHVEKSWQQRFDQVLFFLYKKDQKKSYKPLKKNS